MVAVFAFSTGFLLHHPYVHSHNCNGCLFMSSSTAGYCWICPWGAALSWGLAMIFAAVSCGVSSRKKDATNLDYRGIKRK
jgi:hypothetical protein